MSRKTAPAAWYGLPAGLLEDRTELSKQDAGDDYTFTDEHDGSQFDDDEDGDKITLEEIDENFASLGLDFHSKRGTSPARDVREREEKNARTSDVVWLSVSLEENWAKPPQIGRTRVFDHSYAARVRWITVEWIGE